MDLHEDWKIIEQELAAYGHGLIDRPRLLVLNKQELINSDLQNELVKALEKASGQKLIVISAAMSKGLDFLLKVIWKQFDKQQIL